MMRSSSAAVAAFANNIIGPGANYLYMARPESTESILDFLPANYALRIIIMAVVVTVFFFLSYLPWYLMDTKAKQKMKAEAQETEKEIVSV
jgi:uncharacterized membrane protein YwaF